MYAQIAIDFAGNVTVTSVDAPTGHLVSQMGCISPPPSQQCSKHAPRRRWSNRCGRMSLSGRHLLAPLLLPKAEGVARGPAAAGRCVIMQAFARR